MVLFPPPFYFVFYISNLLSYIQNNFSYELARPIMGTIFLVYIRLITRVSVEYDEIFHEYDSIVTSRRRVEIQSTSEMSPYFTMTKCNKLFITYLTRSTERLPSLPSSFPTISTISMTVVVTTLFKKR